MKTDLGYSRSNVRLCGMSGGLAYGALGPTHHSFEDLAWTRVIVEAAESTGAIVTIEEHSVCGGLGGAVAEVVVTTRPVPMRILGVPGVFAPTGSAAWLFEHFGLTPEGIRDAALDLLSRKVCHAAPHIKPAQSAQTRSSGSA